MRSAHPRPVSKSAKPRAEAAGARRPAPGPSTAGAAAPAAVIDVRVIPRSARSRVDGLRGQAILIRLAAPPVDGAANDALVAFLSEALALPRRSIRIVAGEKSRDKTIALMGMDASLARARLLG